MGRVSSSSGMIAVCSLLCALLPSCDRSADQVPDAVTIQRTNTALSLRKLPKLPDGAVNVRCWTGGTFAKYMNVKFTASQDQALDYLRRANATHYLEFRIEGKDYRVLATHLLTAAPGGTDRPELWCLTNKTGILSQPWFKSVYDIRHGWYYHYWRDAPARYTMYYDVDSQQFYVYWTYS